MTPPVTLELWASLTVQVTLLIGVAAYVARRQQNSPSADRHWTALHICILLLTAAAWFLPHLRLSTWAALHPAASYPSGATTLQFLGWTCGWIWLVGALAVFIAGVGGVIRATLIVRAAARDEALHRSLVRLVPALDSGSRPIATCFCDAGMGAFCWQLHLPVIALPKVILDFPPDEQAAIVRHELAHLKRQHPLHLFLQRLVEAIYWFHPLVWWASRQAAAAREICCDRDAVASRHDVVAYLRGLIRLVEMQLNAPTLLPAGLAFLGSSSLLRRRAELLANSFETPPPARGGWRTVLAFAIAVVLCAMIWLPINPRASRRAEWSPWPRWTAQTLDTIGIGVRDYEIDGHRLDGHPHGG